jgi:hypothetical protein
MKEEILKKQLNTDIILKNVVAIYEGYYIIIIKKKMKI